MAFFLNKQKKCGKNFFIQKYFINLLIIKYNFMKTFTITEEQIKEAYNDACDAWQKRIKRWFPDAFKKKLEVGKVYKYTSFNQVKFMFKFNGDFGINSCYGFDINGEWSNELRVLKSDVHLYEEVTEQEWENALIKEAEKRGFKKGVKYTYSDNPHLIKTFKDELELGYVVDLVDGKSIILMNGVWAEVIKEEDVTQDRIPTQEEIYIVLEYLKTKTTVNYGK